MSENVVRPEQEPELSENSQLEAAGISDGTLKRHEAVENHIHWAGILILWAVTVAGLVLAFIWIWHLATPDRLHFLSVEQLKDIQTVLLSAVGSSFATEAGKRWLDPRRPV